MKSEVKAVIDVGTNSIKFRMAEKREGLAERVLEDTQKVTRIGEGLRESGVIAPAAMERGAAAIAAFAEEARRGGAAEIAAVGTMALREAKNASAFIALVKERAGIGLKVISGDEEARLSCFAVFTGAAGESAGDGDFIVFDTGGGSTEFIYGAGRAMRKSVSVPVGAVHITERFFRGDPVAPGSVPEAEAFIKETLNKSGFPEEFCPEGVFGGGVSGKFPGVLIGVGGAVTTLASVRRMKMKGEAKIDGALLEYAEVTGQIGDYAGKTLAERRAVPGLLPDRADIVLAGACVVKAVMEALGVSVLTVSARGLRHALMAEIGRN